MSPFSNYFPFSSPKPQTNYHPTFCLYESDHSVLHRSDSIFVCVCDCLMSLADVLWPQCCSLSQNSLSFLFQAAQYAPIHTDHTSSWMNTWFASVLQLRGIMLLWTYVYKYCTLFWDTISICFGYTSIEGMLDHCYVQHSVMRKTRVMKRQTCIIWQAGSQGPAALHGRKTNDSFQPALLLAEVTWEHLETGIIGVWSAHHKGGGKLRPCQVDQEHLVCFHGDRGRGQAVTRSSRACPFGLLTRTITGCVTLYPPVMGQVLVSAPPGCNIGPLLVLTVGHRDHWARWVSGDSLIDLRLESADCEKEWNPKSISARVPIDFLLRSLWLYWEG